MAVNNSDYMTGLKDFGEITGIISAYVLNRHYQKRWYYWYKYSLKKESLTSHNTM